MRGREFAGTERFAIKRRLGAGGMGVVYEAYDRDKKTTVALKLLTRADGAALLRFKREFRALQDVAHPNLVRLEELVEDGEHWFFTMELVDGVDFLSYVRPGPNSRADDGGTELTPSADTMRAERVVREKLQQAPAPLDEARLRSALGQLAQAIFAFHGSGQIHRDIKPTNTLVTADGRVVLLDFGLTTRSELGEQSTELHAVGTAAYMAPEQAASKSLEPAADWYALGVLLYQALTARLPFSGASLEVLMDKQRYEPAPPRALVPEVAADLDSLCVELLRTAPSARPSGREVLKRLGVETVVAGLPTSTTSKFTQALPFVGRTDELELLRSAFEQSRAEPVFTIVRGESGLGKSELVRQFTDTLQRDHPGAVVLLGRCYERESVAYKGFDGIADALGRYMRQLPKERAAELLPLRASLLPRLFPVLQRVEVISQAPREADNYELPEMRRRMFDALRELLVRLAKRHPLVLVIDDLQWTDADSLVLLQEVLSHTDAPKLLLLATMRPVQDAERSKALAAVLDYVQSSIIELGALSQATGQELASLLLPREGEDELASLVQESGGHPFFLQELARYSELRRDGSGTSLDEMLWSRIEELTHEPRRLLELVCIAGSPIGQELAADAAELDYSAYLKAAATLRVAYFARTEGMRKRDHITAFHDRVREVVLARLDGAAARHYHERLAVVLESADAATTNPHALVRHAEAAGDTIRAAEYAKAAGQRAVEAMAFDRAVEFFGKSLELGDYSVEAEHPLRLELGSALENAGRGSEAAKEFMLAVSSATAASAFELRRRAALQYLSNGHIDQGLDLLREVLAAVGLRLSKTPRRALLSFIFLRLRIRLRGLGYRPREESQVAPELLARVDVCQSAAFGLGMADMLGAAEYASRSLLQALRAGESRRLAHALCFYATMTGMVGRGADKILARARPVVQEVNDPSLTAFLDACVGMLDFQQLRFRESRRRFHDSIEVWREHPGSSWESATTELQLLWSLFHLGEISEMRTRWRAAIKDARKRGDLYAITNFSSGLANFVWLADDDPESASSQLRDMMRQWPRHRYHLQHYWELLAATHCDLYVGDAKAAQDRVESGWPAFKRSGLLRIPAVCTEALFLRASTGLALASAEPEGRVGLLRKVRRIARQISRGGAVWSAPLAGLLRAAVARINGNGVQAATQLESAIDGFGVADMKLHQMVARYHLGQLRGGDQGSALVAVATEWMSSQGIKNPPRIVAMLAPGFTPPS